jgi:5'-nucleotidase
MIYLNENVRDVIRRLDCKNLYIVADFDRTITKANSESSWGILEKGNLISPEYTEESLELYNHYFPLEYDNSIEPDAKDRIMHEWWATVIQLWQKYGLSEETVNSAKCLRAMRLRKGAKEFLRKMFELDVPVVIISAGIGNFIERFLRLQGCKFENIHLVSNFIRFENGIATGVGNTIIHTTNKNTVSLGAELVARLADRKDILLLGDNLADAKMVPAETEGQVVRVAFADYNVGENLPAYREAFDVVCTDNASFSELWKVLDLQKA